MESSELWQQVLDAPNDAAVRARYCDTLLHEGDRRAEPFLVGAELERRSRLGGGPRTEELEKHYGQLTQVAAAPFASSLDRWGAKLTFVFGWPGEITIKAADFICHATEIVRTLPVRHLNLLLVNEAPQVFNLPEFGQIVSLQAERQVWSNNAVRALTASLYLGALRWLSLSKTGLSEKQVELLAAAESLRKVAQIDLTKNNCRETVAAADERIARAPRPPEMVDLPPFGKELESKYGRIPWLHVLVEYGEFPLDRYRF